MGRQYLQARVLRPDEAGEHEVLGKVRTSPGNACRISLRVLSVALNRWCPSAITIGVCASRERTSAVAFSSAIGMSQWRTPSSSLNSSATPGASSDWRRP
jgi:hypothetical protein